VIYNIDEITIGDDVVVSQHAYLCAGRHDAPIRASPITIESECWIAARAFVVPSVRIGWRRVVGACSVVQSDVPSATVVAGFPARAIQKRKSRRPIEPRLTPRPSSS
jgi:putative colanic acid biosynthesis acetyltransferase WcaF